MQTWTDVMTVPVTRVGKRVLIGFVEKEYEEAFLDYHG